MLHKVVLKHFLGKFDFADCIEDTILGIDREAIEAVVLKGGGYHFAQGVAIFLFIVHLVLAEEVLVVFLAELCGLNHDYLLDLHAEIAVMGGCLGLVDIEHRREFILVAFASRSGIEHYGFSDLFPVKESFLSLILEV